MQVGQRFKIARCWVHQLETIVVFLKCYNDGVASKFLLSWLTSTMTCRS